MKYKIIASTEVSAKKMKPFVAGKDINCQLSLVDIVIADVLEKVWVVDTFSMEGERITAKLSDCPRLKLVESKLEGETSETLTHDLTLQKEVLELLSLGFSLSPRENIAMDRKVLDDLSEIIEKYKWKKNYNDIYKMLSTLVTDFHYKHKFMVANTESLVKAMLGICKRETSVKSPYSKYFSVKNRLSIKLKDLLTTQYQLDAQVRINKGYEKSIRQIESGSGLKVITAANVKLEEKCEILHQKIARLTLDKKESKLEILKLKQSEGRLEKALKKYKVRQKELVTKLSHLKNDLSVMTNKVTNNGGKISKLETCIRELQSKDRSHSQSQARIVFNSFQEDPQVMTDAEKMNEKRDVQFKGSSSVPSRGMSFIK